MPAELVEFGDVRSPIPLSGAVRFFHKYPRFGRSNRFATEESYYRTIGLVAVPWLVVALISLLVGIITVVVLAARRRRQDEDAPGGVEAGKDVDGGAYAYTVGASGRLEDGASSVSSMSTDRTFSDGLGRKGAAATTGRVIDILFSALTVLSLFTFIGVGLVAVDAFRTSVLTLLLAGETLVTQLKVAIVPVLEYVVGLSPLASELGAIPQIGNIVTTGFQQAQSLLGTSQSSLTTAADLIDTLERVADIVFLCLLIILIVLLSAPALTFLVGVCAAGIRGRTRGGGDAPTESTRSRRRHARTAVMLGTFLIPMPLAWALVGIATSAGALVGDVCVTAEEWHRVVLSQATGSSAIAAGVDASTNRLLQSSLSCPSEMAEDGVLEGAQLLVQTASQLAGQVVADFTGADRADVDSAFTFVTRQLDALSECNFSASFASRLLGYGCSDRVESTAASLQLLWAMVLGLAIALTLTFALAAAGLDVTSAVTASAFGSVVDPLAGGGGGGGERPRAGPAQRRRPTWQRRPTLCRACYRPRRCRLRPRRAVASLRRPTPQTGTRRPTRGASTCGTRRLRRWPRRRSRRFSTRPPRRRRRRRRLRRRRRHRRRGWCTQRWEGRRHRHHRRHRRRRRPCIRLVGGLAGDECRMVYECRRLFLGLFGVAMRAAWAVRQTGSRPYKIVTSTSQRARLPSPVVVPQATPTGVCTPRLPRVRRTPPQPAPYSPPNSRATRSSTPPPAARPLPPRAAPRRGRPSSAARRPTRPAASAGRAAPCDTARTVRGSGGRAPPLPTPGAAPAERGRRAPTPPRRPQTPP
ncbi:hypothetical protein BU14_0501s0021 [Porphyra umbilicalis]|uniref:Uncharacterized protein n=1 Tax=Porphyra umbilicalis TaxID=2786 RepID=A0A1X6NT70_PORUM|nr:hypothetical protein BU14_0501s0021 [Porphyra umbilicalis]|eukprot:OSX71801.1 hypothetical protein BU14_0501s0021 [Porphyra umbilicalis]